MLKLSAFELRENGDITFRSSIFLGRYYRFRGTLHLTEIVGKMELVTSNSGTIKRSWQVRASARSGGSAHVMDRESLPSIHLSNVNYSEAGGDLSGVDVVILRGSRRPAGMLVFYESYWGDSTFTPFAILNVERARSTIRFQVKESRGETGYHLRSTRDGKWLLYRDDVKSTKGFALVAMKPLLPQTSP
jgi:hypothetical protein